MRRTTTMALLLSAATAAPAWAGGNGNSQKGQGNAPSQPVIVGQLSVSAVITSSERQIIQTYIGQHPAAFADVKPLPPGIAKKLARGGTLPPGIAKRYFPADLIGQLPARPGQQWMVVGTDVLLVQAATSVILDLMQRAF
jgi:hypothetical protein